ncbi:hypothetical protein SY88_07220 [Clostridiales bacterium PH28_bin88]|nr:hypothetical protein SY88_07220 [Clostridiales bacterium PH28_bin88]
MWRWFRANLGYRILSILLALGLWMYVVEDQNPIVEQVLSVPLETRALPGGLVISDRPATVKVRLEGRQGQVQDLSSRDVRAFVELNDARTGENVVPVQATVPKGVDIVSISPERVTVSVDKVTEKQVPVTVTVDGKPASGYRLLDPVLKPSQVIVTGPHKSLDQIDRAFVEVTVEGVKENYLEKLPLRVGSGKEDNKALEWVNVKPDTVEVFIPVVQELPVKQVPVQVDVQGTPADGYRVAGVTFEPRTVKVSGPQEVLDTLESLTTKPVDVNGATADVVGETELVLPAGVNAGTLPPVKVVIQITANP